MALTFKFGPFSSCPDFRYLFFLQICIPLLSVAFFSSFGHQHLALLNSLSCLSLAALLLLLGSIHQLACLCLRCSTATVPRTAERLKRPTRLQKLLAQNNS